MTKIVLFTQNTMASIVASREIIKNNSNKIKAIALISQIQGNLYGQGKIAYKFIKKSSKEFFIYKIIESKLYNILIKVHRIFKTKKYKKGDAYSIEELAKKHNIPLIYTTDVNNLKFLNKIKSYSPDYVFCLVAQILKKEVFNTLGDIMINSHGSYLPEYRGPAQYFWYLFNADSHFGITVHHMTTGLDTGDIIFQKKFPYDNKISAYKLHHKMSVQFGKMFNEFINKYSNKKYKKIKQKHNLATHTRMPTKRDMYDFKLNNKKLIELNDFLECV